MTSRVVLAESVCFPVVVNDSLGFLALQNGKRREM